MLAIDNLRQIKAKVTKTTRAITPTFRTINVHRIESRLDKLLGDVHHWDETVWVAMNDTKARLYKIAETLNLQGKGTTAKWNDVRTAWEHVQVSALNLVVEFRRAPRKGVKGVHNGN